MRILGMRGTHGERKVRIAGAAPDRAAPGRGRGARSAARQRGARQTLGGRPEGVFSVAPQTWQRQ